MAYFVLAGGYWSKSVNPDMGGRQVEPKAGDIERSIDYIIKIDGLPRDILNFETTYHKKYFCEDCQRTVSEGEMEGRFGCFGHKIKTEYEKIELSAVGVFERYKPRTVPWLDDCYRIWLDAEPGCDKWREIWRYVDTHVSRDIRVIPMPVPVGRGNQWVVTPEEVSYIDLRAPEEIERLERKQKEVAGIQEKAAASLEKMKAESVDVRKNKKHKGYEEIACDVCGKKVKGKNGLRLHKLKAHKEAVAAAPPEA